MENTELAIANNQNLYISPVVELDEAKAKFETKYADIGAKVTGLPDTWQ